MKRGAVNKRDSKMLTVWVPEELFPYIDVGVALCDSDRSKFVRTAIREKLERHGVAIKEAA